MGFERSGGRRRVRWGVSVVAIVMALVAPVERLHAQARVAPQGQKLVGKVHEHTRASKERHEFWLSEDAERAHGRYAKARQQIETETGITYSMEASSLSQWGAPNGGYARCGCSRRP